MAEQEKKPEQKEQPEQQPQEKQGVKKEYVFAAVAVVLIAAAAFLLLQPRGEPELPLKDFKTLVNSTPKLSVVQDLRGLPADDSDARMALQNCAIQLSYALSYLGKNVTNYAIEGSECYGGSTSSARTSQECLSEASREGRLLFTLGYNSTQNKTLLTAKGAYYFGGTGFLSDCTITGLVQ